MRPNGVGRERGRGIMSRGRPGLNRGRASFFVGGHRGGRGGHVQEENMDYVTFNRPHMEMIEPRMPHPQGHRFQPPFGHMRGGPRPFGPMRDDCREPNFFHPGREFGIPSRPMQMPLRHMLNEHQHVPFRPPRPFIGEFCPMLPAGPMHRPLHEPPMERMMPFRPPLSRGMIRGPPARPRGMMHLPHFGVGARPAGPPSFRPHMPGQLVMRPMAFRGRMHPRGRGRGSIANSCANVTGKIKEEPEKKTNRELRKPWVNEIVKNEIMKKHKMQSLAKKTRKTEDWDAFKEQRNKVTTMIRESRLEYIGAHPEEDVDKIMADASISNSVKTEFNPETEINSESKNENELIEKMDHSDDDQHSAGENVGDEETPDYFRI